MIVYTPASERSLSLFRTPFEQALDPENRWVRMAALVPWDEMAKVFFVHMSESHGRASVDLRVVLGALLVKHVEGISDEDTIQYIQENIYAQYFVGLPSFQVRPVFSATLFVEIRKRLGQQGSAYLNDELLKQALKLKAIKHRKKRTSSRPKGQEEQDPPAADAPSESPSSEANTDSGSTPAAQPPNRGTLKLDATVAPQHVGYPTDTRLLHEARQYSEQLIDTLYERTKFWTRKPRTYRRVARKKYLSFAKKRKASKKAIRRTKREQLGYLRRNLKHLHRMLDELEVAGVSIAWQAWHWRKFWVLQEFYRQQDLMYRDSRRRVDDRIVNIAQPYVRPIKRGKPGKSAEFGAKLNVSETEGFVRVDQVDFDSFHEGKGLILQVEAYKQLYGYYPAQALVDKAYLTRPNRKYLKDRGIDHPGPPLGRPPQLTKSEKDRRRKAQNKRSHIEGKFGQGKSKYGLDDIQTRREDTSYACIGLIMLALNLIKLANTALFSLFASLKDRVSAHQIAPFRFKVSECLAWATTLAMRGPNTGLCFGRRATF